MVHRVSRVVVLAVLAALAPRLAVAAWFEASSAHFVIYADDRERDVEAFAGQLERFHAAVAYVTGVKSPPPSPSNRVTVYVVDSRRDVRNLYGGDNRYVAGFYRPAPGATRAFVPPVGRGTTELPFSMIVLLHEYTHHFMLTGSTAPMPRWYSEGAAEFFASAAFRADGGVELGLPARHRGAELFYAADVTATDLLDPAAYADRKRKGYDAFYGKSWLLFHYLTFSKERQGQLTRYTTRLGQGATSREAAVEVFGDLNALEKELDSYVRSRSLPFLPLQASLLEPGSIRLRKLRPGEAEMMPVRIRSQAGVSREEALELLPEARKVAARFPDDPMVLAALAEAEHDAGNNAEAIAAADAALARDPAQVDAYIIKGRALFSLAAEDAAPAAAYARARAPFLALNKLENDHPVPLLYYYYSFVKAGQPATANAFAGLERAVDFAPFAPSLRMTLATEQIQRGDLAAARRNLEPVAYNPHAGKLGESAQRVLDRMAGPEPWDGKDLESVLGEPADSE
jgi:hypothetical protein